MDILRVLLAKCTKSHFNYQNEKTDRNIKIVFRRNASVRECSVKADDDRSAKLESESKAKSKIFF